MASSKHNTPKQRSTDTKAGPRSKNGGRNQGRTVKSAPSEGYLAGRIADTKRTSRDIFIEKTAKLAATAREVAHAIEKDDYNTKLAELTEGMIATYYTKTLECARGTFVQFEQLRSSTIEENVAAGISRGIATKAAYRGYDALKAAYRIVNLGQSMDDAIAAIQKRTALKSAPRKDRATPELASV